MDTIQSGLMLNHFRIEHQLGSGGMGSVYCGTDTTLNRQVAIKILDRRLQDVPENRERFQREARIIAGLRHPNLMQIYYVGEDQGVQYFVMEYIRGSSLQSVLSRQGGKLPLKEALRILVEVVSALHKVHGNGIIHRDLKPANIMVDEDDGRAILVDFGLSKDCEESAGLTSDGSILGTPDYMAPEQIEGGELGPATDIYALGVILYLMLSGVSPFRRKTTIQTLRAHCESAPPPITTHVSNIPGSLVAVIDRMLAKSAQERFRNIEELAAALNAVCKHPALSRIINSAEQVTPDAKTMVAATSMLEKKVSVHLRDPGETPTAHPRQPGKVIVAAPVKGQAPAHPVRLPLPTKVAPAGGKRGQTLLIGAVIGFAAFLLALIVLAHFRPHRDAKKPVPPVSANPAKTPEPAIVVTPAPAITPAIPALPQPVSPSAPEATKAPALPLVTYLPAGNKAPSPAVAAPEIVVLMKSGGRMQGRLDSLTPSALKIVLNSRLTQEVSLQEIRAIISLESARLDELLIKEKENRTSGETPATAQPQQPARWPVLKLLRDRQEGRREEQPLRPEQRQPAGGTHP